MLLTVGDACLSCGSHPFASKLSDLCSSSLVFVIGGDACVEQNVGVHGADLGSERGVRGRSGSLEPVIRFFGFERGQAGWAVLSSDQSGRPA